MKHLIRVAAFAVCTALAAPVGAQTVDDAIEAYAAEDYELAREILQPLAEQGEPWAQVLLGVLYDEGLGVLQDYSGARRWYDLAADQGLAHAQYLIGGMYREGRGIDPDLLAARDWYRRAATQGHEAAQYELGITYGPWTAFVAAASQEDNEGISGDIVVAHMWLNIAAANGFEDAREKRNLMETRMSTEEIAEAQSRAQLCMASDYQDCD